MRIKKPKTLCTRYYWQEECLSGSRQDVTLSVLRMSGKSVFAGRSSPKKRHKPGATGQKCGGRGVIGAA